jgi:hypothetical protein
MSHQFTEQEINSQREKVFNENPSLELVAPCKLGEGILRLSSEEKANYIEKYIQKNVPICFFIPASGSGSRMFEFLYAFLEEPNDENRSKVERFLNSISDFAFFKQLPKDKQRAIKEQTIEFEEIVSYILNPDGLGYGHLPKGLIPFHSNDPFILNPFQEQLLQGAKLQNDKFSFHFTIQSAFEKEIRSGIEHIEGLSGANYNVDFTEQSVRTNSIAFDESKNVCYNDKNELISRPAGHGALLSHLNEIEDEIVFIKNIDNLQHYKNSDLAIQTWKLLGGLLLDFKAEAKKVFDAPNVEGLLKLNERFQVFSESQLKDIKTDDCIKALLNRPARVCGMVKNEGQPGGGPFWVNDNGVVTKQIVEKAQISMKGDQYRLMIQSTHFNPVMIAASSVSFDGQKFDLMDYKDDSKYFIVRKKHHGKAIRFLELPGLWNGSMANWNTLFLEIPSETFSPVKTVLDLLEDAHKG